MKLNQDSKLASFYRYFYLTATLPNNLCHYFWGLILAFVSLPFLWMAVAINMYNKRITWSEKWSEYSVSSSAMTTFTGIFIQFYALIFGAGIEIFLTKYLSIDFKGITSLPLALLTAIGLGILVSALIVGIFILVIALIKVYDKTITDEEKEAMAEAKYQKWLAKDRNRTLNPSFISLAWDAIVAFKEKNCPMITWSKEIKSE